MSTRRILGEVEDERQVQDMRWGGQDHDDGHTAAEWVALVARHLGLSFNDGAGEIDRVRFRRQMLRVAALAVACVEAIDRQAGVEHGGGCPFESRGSGA